MNANDINTLSSLFDKKLAPFKKAITSLEKRVEEVRVDTARIATDVAVLKLRMSSLETSVGIIKIDVKATKENVDDLINTTEILKNMITLREHTQLEQRVKRLEQS